MAEDRKARQPSRVARLIDRAVEAVAPARAVRRERARRMLGAAGWDVTSTGRRRRRRSLTAGSADKHLGAATLIKLREICRAHDRESALLSGILNRAVTNIVGARFSVWPATADEGWNKAAKEYIDSRMSLAADVKGMTDFRGLLGMALRTQWTDGDCVLVHAGDSLQMYEADQLATPRDRKDIKIVNGVEVDKPTGRPVAFWLAGRQYGGYVDTAKNATRIPAADAIYPANLKRCSQTRGVPELAAPLGIYDRLDGYLDNETFAAEINAMLAFWVKHDVTYTDSTAAPGQEDQAGEAATSAKLQKLENGSIIDLFPGEEIGSFRPDRPTDAFSHYITTVLRMVGASIGQPLELVLLDFSKTNYSSARAALLEAQRGFQCWQNFLRDRLCRPIYFRWIGQAIRRRILTPIDDAFAARWYPPKWAWVDPLKEVLAAEKSVAAGFTTLTDVIEREGRTLAEYVSERAVELAAFKDAKIPTTTAEASKGLLPGEEAALRESES